VRGTPAHATAALLRACGPHSALKSGGGSGGGKKKAGKVDEEEAEDERKVMEALAAAGLKEGDEGDAPVGRCRLNQVDP
jgi:hypothetical protein